MNVKVTVEIKPNTLYLKKPFRISRDIYDHKVGYIVCISALDKKGFGEANEHVYYQVSQKNLHESLLVGKQVIEKNELMHPKEMYALLEGVVPLNFARAALDIAYWNLYAKIKKQPIYKLLDLSMKDWKSIKTSFTISIDSNEEMVKSIQENLFHAYKIKLGTEHDLATMKVLKSATDKPFMVDANCGWDLEFAIQFCQLYDHQSVYMIEQPFPKGKDDWAQELRKHTQIPIIADESMTSLVDAQRCLQSYDGINIKLLKCGGLTPSLEIFKFARNNDLLVMIGCMMESSIGISAGAQLAGWADYVDLDSILFLKEDIPPFVQIGPQGSIVIS